jgi:hypothetical protein
VGKALQSGSLYKLKQQYILLSYPKKFRNNVREFNLFPDSSSGIGNSYIGAGGNNELP